MRYYNVVTWKSSSENALAQKKIPFISIEDTYDVVKSAHIATGHGGRNRMIKEVNKKYANISREVLGIYKLYCQECQWIKICAVPEKS